MTAEKISFAITGINYILKYILIENNYFASQYYSYNFVYVTLDHKTSLKSQVSSHGYICSNSQQYIVWVKIIDFSFMPKIITILSKDHV